mgnify:CR=1 FL=1
MELIEIGQQLAQYVMGHTEFLAGGATGFAAGGAIAAAYHNPLKVADGIVWVIERVPGLMGRLAANPQAFETFVEAVEARIYAKVREKAKPPVSVPQPDAPKPL